MNSGKTYASVVKCGKGVKGGNGVKKECEIKEESKIKAYCECCRKEVKYVEFKDWCNMFMCDDCDNWIRYHGC
jgi:hypothetical protein